MNPDQINVRPTGPFAIPAGEDLTGKRSRLVVLTHDTGAPEVLLPAANGADALYQLQEEGADTELVSVERFASHREFRVPLKGTCNPGDRLVLANVGTAADKGKVRLIPGTTGTYRVLAIAREAGVDGQHVKCDPVGPFDVAVA